MNDSESQFLPPKLPPKRAPLSGNKNKPNDAELREEDQSFDEDIDPELLAAFEQAVINTPTEVEVDLSIPPPSKRVTAPILEDYIDPFAVPILQLLDRANIVKEEDDEESEETNPSQI